ncbi:unnamed protein product [Owenia fusiformis]|uniref:Uncharacterized protein n=1 Tax=Owenia fusiformis TaxID=6347 RepID=A0A8J1UHQ7_OWEFU|nr:unnamed protein product [Owenia fusiformis]
MYEDTFTFYGAARAEADIGSPKLQEILQSSIKCNSCDDLKAEFIFHTTYHQLKIEEHYKTLCENMNSKHAQAGTTNDSTEDETVEFGRLFYLSIPPSAYSKTAELIDKYCRPQAPTWFRIIIEKPFGHDKKSSVELAEQLVKYFKDEEMFRIDHYLGKSIAKQILPFRFHNTKNYDHIWNRDHIEKIEIMMKEEVDVKGRVNFYDECGVIRDVMQNHLTELLVLVTMELPKNINNITEIQQRKLQLLQQVSPVKPKQVLLGQYASYQSELIASAASEHVASKTPTFAASLVNIDNARWKGVPILLVAGKKLHERASYIKITFKRQIVCFEDGDSWDNTKCSPYQQMLFNIGGGSIGIPAIVISQSLPYPTAVAEWTNSQQVDYFKQPGNSFNAFTAKTDIDAYSSLISEVYKNNKQYFVGTDQLLASWDIWTPLLNDLHNIPLQEYSGWDEDTDILKFQHAKNQLKFFTEKHKRFEATEIPSSNSDMQSIPATFRGRKLIVSPKSELIEKLADHILDIASRSIDSKGNFHLALSGGSSPIELMQHMAEHAQDFPWHKTHIWLVDERCLPLTQEHSNFYSIHTHLIKHIEIPYFNIHPMPVELNNGLCISNDNGNAMYEKTLNKETDGILDYILLGVGQDGHTASLFPNQPSLEMDDKGVALTQGGSNETSVNRMSLTFNTINNAKHVSVLIVGGHKHDILHKISNTDNQKLFPITGVSPDDGTMAWFVDTDAYLNH